MKNRFAATVAAILWAMSPFALAQTPTGTLQGTVTDQTGAAVANAQVTVTNSATNVTNKLTTDVAGRYVLPFVIPGTYTVAVQAKGFASARTENVKIDVSQDRRSTSH